MIKCPSQNEVSEQLKREFDETSVKISDEEIEQLSQIVNGYFSKMMNMPDVYAQTNPCMFLWCWETEKILYKRKCDVQKRYRNVSLKRIELANLTIHIVVAWDVKRINIYFVEPMAECE